MKIMSYEYRDKRSTMPQFLYVDADYDTDLLPPKVREIIAKSGRPNTVGFHVISGMGKAAVDLFKARHYLDYIFDMVEDT